MKVAILEGLKSLSIKDVPLPKAEKGEVILKVTHCAVCRTDAKMWEALHRDLVIPRILGHEIVGIIPETGFRFVLWPGMSCGKCADCFSGNENRCREMRITGFHRNGGFAEYVAVPEESLVGIPDDLPLELACFAEPVACVLNAFGKLKKLKGKKAGIYGAGPVGLMASAISSFSGAEAILIEKNPLKIEKCASFAFETGIVIKKKADIKEFDIVLNAAPSAEAFSDALSGVSSGGEYIFFSGISGSDHFPVGTLNELHYKEVSLYGAYGCTKKNMADALEIIEKNTKVFKSLTEKIISLEDLPEILPQILKGESFKFIVGL